MCDFVILSVLAQYLTLVKNIERSAVRAISTSNIQMYKPYRVLVASTPLIVYVPALIFFTGED